MSARLSSHHCGVYVQGMIVNSNPHQNIDEGCGVQVSKKDYYYMSLVICNGCEE